jgi:hypothetical protein
MTAKPSRFVMWFSISDSCLGNRPSLHSLLGICPATVQTDITRRKMMIRRSLLCGFNVSRGPRLRARLIGGRTDAHLDGLEIVA